MNCIKLFFISLLCVPCAFGFDVYNLSKFDIDTSTEVKPFSYVLEGKSSKPSIATGIISSPQTLLPFVNASPIYDARLLHDSLFRKNLENDMQYIPLIATHARMDNLRNWVEFDINQNAKFSDGSNIKASDIEFSYNFYLKTGDVETRKELSNILSVKILNDFSIRFDLRKQSMDTILFLANLPILSEKSWKDGSTSKTSGIAFSGGYILENNSLKNARLIRNPNYGLSDIPANMGYNNFDEITINSYPNSGSLKNALQKGDIDVALSKISNPDNLIGTIQIKENDEIISGIFLNTSRPVFKDKKTRQGFLILLSSFIPIQSPSLFANHMYQGRLINTASSALSPYYDSRLDKNIFSSSSPFDTVKNLYQTRTQQARGLNALKDAGFQYNQGELSKNGRKITVNVLLDSNDEKQVSQMDVIKKQLTPLGFNFQVSQSSSQEYERRLQNFEYDMAFVKKEFDITSRRSFESFFNNGGANNYSRLNSSQLQNSVNDLDNAQTLEQYKYQIKVLDKIVLFEYIFLPLTQENIKTIYSNKPIRCPQNISGFKISLCIIS